jgi:glycosyltransferase involved in cell wall biosynthesis
LLVVSHPAVIPVNQSVYVELQRRGWSVRLVTPRVWRHEFAADSFPAQPLPDLSGEFSPQTTLLTGRPQRHFYVAPLAKQVRRWRPDVLFAEQEPFSVSALQWCCAAARVGIPFGVQAAENLDRTLPVPARAIRSFVLPRVAFVSARSPAAADLVAKWGFSGRIDVVPHAVPGWESRGQRVSSETFTVGFAGRLTPEKGLHDLVAAVRRLPTPVRLLLVGDGALRDDMVNTSLPNGFVEVRTGVDHDDMPSAFADMDVLVLPSRTTPRWAEQFGRVLVEAMSCDVPVVGSSSGEIPWVVQTTGGGLVFPEGDVAALARCLDGLRRDPLQRAALAAAGRRTVSERFSVPACTSAFEAQLQSVLAEPS